MIVVTDYELGLVAWAIGGMAGYAVVLPVKTSITRIHQVVTVIASLIGIVLRKYFFFSYIWNDGMSMMFDLTTLQSFTEFFSELFGGFDLIFVLLLS